MREAAEGSKMALGNDENGPFKVDMSAWKSTLEKKLIKNEPDSR